jgi:hypothetical protein
LKPFHSEAEAEAGIDLDSLLNEARTFRAERQSRIVEGIGSGAAAGSGDKSQGSAIPGTADSGSSATASELAAVNALARLKLAPVTCILKGQPYALCGVGGRRMVMGDVWPDTEFKVTEITERGVTFSDGKATVQLGLALPGAMNPPGRSIPEKEGS